MNLSQIQKERDAWVHHNFPDDRIEDSFMGMVEELGELSHHLLKRKQGIRGHVSADYHDAQIKDATADLIIFALGIASHEGFDLMDVVEETWLKVRERDWIKFPVNGVTE